MIFHTADANRLYTVPFRETAHERPQPLSGFANQQRFTILRAKNAMNVERKKRISHAVQPSLRDGMLLSWFIAS
jgi:hypothetical protein